MFMNKKNQSVRQRHCCHEIDPEFERFCLEDVLAMAQRTKELSEEKKDFFIENDIESIRTRIQICVNKNNHKAELELLSSKNVHSSVAYASVEERLSDLYRLFLLEYRAVVEVAVPLHKFKLVLYFDNYFNDFEEQLNNIRQEKPKDPMAHSFYLKMYKVTMDKLASIYRAYIENIKDYKESYVYDHRYAVDIAFENKRYKLEYALLLDEFRHYAKAYLEALEAYEACQEAFENDYNNLKERFAV